MDIHNGMALDSDHCPLCKSGEVTALFQSRLGCSVRSNSTPWGSSVEILQCDVCDHLFKPMALSCAAADYKHYSAMSDKSTEDKLDFSAHYPVQRSKIILDYIKATGNLLPGYRVLDYGCHRGAFLRLLWSGAHTGFDLSEEYRDHIEHMGFSFYSNKARLPRAEFDLAVMIHVLEHFLEVDEDIQPLVQALRSKGLLLVQVPDLTTQPTDMYIMDHRHHFFADTLNHMMHTLNFSSVLTEKVLISGELTGLYQVASENNRSGPYAFRGKALNTEELISYLSQGEDNLQQLKQSGETFWIYGAGNLGVLIANYLGEQAKGYIDDQPSRQDTFIQGLPVLALEAVRKRRSVIIAVPPGSVKKPILACLERQLNHHVPFGELKESLVQVQSHKKTLSMSQ